MQRMLAVRAFEIEYIRQGLRVETVLGLDSVRIVGHKIFADLLILEFGSYVFLFLVLFER